MTVYLRLATMKRKPEKKILFLKDWELCYYCLWKSRHCCIDTQAGSGSVAALFPTFLFFGGLG